MTACPSERFELYCPAAFRPRAKPGPVRDWLRFSTAGLLMPLLFCLLIAGCGSGNNLARVRGKVTLNGRPLADALVEFQPTAPGGSPSSGTTDAEGRYELMYTFAKPGATPGQYAVTIRTGGTCLDNDCQEIDRAELVPAQYNTRTELKRTVEPGRNILDFEL